MNVQFISDSNGETTGVYIPIQEWNELKSKFKGIELEEINIPDWHKEIVRERMADFKNNPQQAVDFDQAMNQTGRLL